MPTEENGLLDRRATKQAPELSEGVLESRGVGTKSSGWSEISALFTEGYLNMTSQFSTLGYINMDRIQRYEGPPARKKVPPRPRQICAARQGPGETAIMADAVKDGPGIPFDSTHLESQRDSEYERVCDLSSANAPSLSPAAATPQVNSAGTRLGEVTTGSKSDESMGRAINDISISTTNDAVLETTIAPLLPKALPQQKSSWPTPQASSDGDATPSVRTPAPGFPKLHDGHADAVYEMQALHNSGVKIQETQHSDAFATGFAYMPQQDMQDNAQLVEDGFSGVGNPGSLNSGFGDILGDIPITPRGEFQMREDPGDDGDNLSQLPRASPRLPSQSSRMKRRRSSAFQNRRFEESGPGPNGRIEPHSAQNRKKPCGVRRSWRVGTSSSQPRIANRSRSLRHRGNIERGLDDEASGEEVHFGGSPETERTNKDNSKHPPKKVRDRYRNQSTFTGDQHTEPGTTAVGIALSQPAVDQALARGILKRLEEVRHLARAASTLGSSGFDRVADEVQHLQSWLLSAVVSQQKPERSCKIQVPDGASRFVQGGSSGEDDEDDTDSGGAEDGQEIEYSSDEGTGPKERSSRLWTDTEEKKLKSLVQKGASWKEIAKALHPRSETAVMLHWYQMLKRKGKKS